jgi:serine/threonine-protein kinase
MHASLSRGLPVSNGFASEPSSPVKPGDLVGGKYRVERTLGAGGMGVVVSAVQVELDRSVALKFLLPKVLESPDLVSRFAREARAAAKLQSEHVVRILDVGTLENGAPYMVMEFLEGEDLSQVIAKRGPLPYAEAIALVLEAIEAVAEAHAVGIVHRDLKPANLFLAKRTNGTPLIKVLDFGLSKISAPGEAHVTSTSSLLGSPAYMSPEQLWSSRNADARSDIWSLGVVLYELLTAHTPFPHERMPELVAAILHSPPRPMEQWQVQVPAPISAVISRCLEKEPAQRFATVGELARDLAAFGPPSAARSLEHISNTLARMKSDQNLAERTPSSQPPLVQAAPQHQSDSVPGASQTIKTPRREALLQAAEAGPRKRRAVAWIIAAVGALALIVGFLAVSAPRGKTIDTAVSASSERAEPHAVASPNTQSENLPAIPEETPPDAATKPERTTISSAEASRLSVPPREPARHPKAGAPAGLPGASVIGPPGSAAPPADPLTRLKPM